MFEAANTPETIDEGLLLLATSIRRTIRPKPFRYMRSLMYTKYNALVKIHEHSINTVIFTTAVVGLKLSMIHEKLYRGDMLKCKGLYVYDRTGKGHRN